MKKNKLLLILPIMFILLLSLVSAVATAPDNDDVVSYYPLENLTDSNKLFNLTNSGATSGVTGVIDDAYSFDGFNDRMTHSSNDLGSSYSISLWVKLDDTTSEGYIIAGASGSTTGRYDGLIRIYSGAFRFIGESFDSGADTTSSLSTGTWYYVVGVADGLSRKIYLDGDLEGSTTETNNAQFDTNRLIGKRDDGRYFEGDIDELIYFDSILSSDEIDYLYNEGSPTSNQQFEFTNGVANNFSVTAKNFYNDSSIDDFVVKIDPLVLSETYTTLWANTTNIQFIKDADTITHYVTYNGYDYLVPQRCVDDDPTYLRLRFYTGLTSLYCLDGGSGYVVAPDYTENDDFVLTESNLFWREASNGTIKTTFLENDTNLYDVEVYSDVYFSEVYSDVNLSSDLEAILHQSEISFASYEYLSNSSLTNCTYTIDGVVNTTFYLNVGNNTVLASCFGYYPLNYSFNVVALQNETLSVEGSYNNLATFNFKDVVTGDVVPVNTSIFIEGASALGGSVSVQSYTNSTGTVSFPFLQGAFNITAFSTDYATLIENITINSTVQEFNFSLYANNSLWVTAIDQVTGSALNNFAIEVYNVADSFTTNDNLTFKATLDNITSGVYTVKVTKDNYAVSEYALTVTGGSHQNLVAYMTANGSSTIFTVVDAITNQIVEGAGANMYKTINSTWTLVSSQTTDITGRVQYTYVPDVEYKFVIDGLGYELRTFFLKPLFSTYTIRLTPDVTSVPDENTGSYLYSINNSCLFYNDLNNSFEISILSGTGTIEYYDLTVTNFNGSTSEFTCLVAGGCTDSFNFEILSADFSDVVTVEYSIKESGRSLKYFKKVYHVQDVYLDGTLEGFKDVDDADVDSLTKAFIAMIVCLIMVGFVSVGSIMVGLPPVTASGIVLALLVGVFAYVGFIPAFASGIIILGCLLILIFGRGEI